MNMARYEQETIINFNEEEKTAGIYTHNKMLRQKLAALARDRPEDCRLVKASRSGRAVDYTIPKSWIKIVPPRTASEAQKEARRLKRPFLPVRKPRAGIIETAHDRQRVVIPSITQKRQKQHIEGGHAHEKSNRHHRL